MSLCINPSCPQPDHPLNLNNRYCQGCGSDLLLKDRYRVTRLLTDHSGFGKIFAAEEQGNPKILKVLKEHLNNNPKAVELFQQEANALTKLQHPGIPQVDGYFQYQTRHELILHCIVMEKIEGLNLEEWLQQQGNHPISEAQALAWLKQLAEILHQVHQQKYFHRDIKPSNIMLKDGQLVLIDFGTAREATYTYLAKMASGYQVTAVVSAGYTPPEQMNSQAVPQSDFFALGRTFVHLLTGQHPANFYHSHNNLFWWRPYANISPSLGDLLDTLMAPKPGDRPMNTQVLLQKIDELPQKRLRRVQGYSLMVAATCQLFLLIGGVCGFIFAKLHTEFVLTRSETNSETPVVSSSPIPSPKTIAPVPDPNFPNSTPQPLPSLPQELILPPTSVSMDYSQLESFLKAKKWQEADAATRNLMLKIAHRQKEGWLDVKSIGDFPCEDLATINQLWLKYSQGKFAFTVQKSIWDKEFGNTEDINKVYGIFGDRVGWRVKNNWLKYDEYNFTLDAPKGHLPQMFNENKLPSNRLSVLSPKLDQCNII
jgi:serine/threonine protein kinase